MANGEANRIMTKPLPEILAEIEDSIRLADEAARNAREAAVEARKAGEKAANDATRIANERIAKVEQIAKDALQLARLLRLALMDTVTAMNERLSESPQIQRASPKTKQA